MVYNTACGLDAPCKLAPTTGTLHPDHKAEAPKVYY